MLTNSIILAISKHNTLRPLGILFGPFANKVRGIYDGVFIGKRLDEKDSVEES